MARFEILIKPSAVKEIEAIARKKDRQRIVFRIRQLGMDLRGPGCQKLSGRELYRVRQGSYRIVYSIADEQLVVCVVRVAHRKEAYRGFL